MAQMVIEQAIETGSAGTTGIVSLLKAVTWISANIANVIGYGNGPATKDMPLIVVNANPARKIEPNYNYWECPVEIVCMTRPSVDDNRSKLNRMYAEVMGWANGVTTATLATATGLTVDGKVMAAGTDEVSPQAEFQAKTVLFNLYVTKS